MSTKATIAYGENFHFYHEAMDEDHVYLELETTHFEAGYGRVMLPIPIHIWETIRHLGGARLDLVNRTDEALLAMVEAAVDARITRYQEALRTHPERAGLMSLAGSLVYGGTEDPRMEQIARGMEYYRHERQRQREIQAAIGKLREAQRHTMQVLLHLNEPQIAADLLIMLMRHMSQEYFATPWSGALESQLWEAVHGQRNTFQKQGEQARYLSEKCQGWATWDATANQPKYVSLSEWEGMYGERLMHRLEEQQL